MPQFLSAFYKNGTRVATIARVMCHPFPPHFKPAPGQDTRTRYIFTLEAGWMPSRGDNASMYTAETLSGPVAVTIERVDRADQLVILTTIVNP